MRDIRLVGDAGAAQGTLIFRVFAVAIEQMRFICMRTDDLSVFRELEALFGAGMRFDFRHDSLVLLG